MGIAAAIGATILGGVTGAVVARRAQGGATPEPPPPPPPPTPMPTPGDDQSAAAQRRALAAQMGRRGRQSTILSQPDSSDKLGN
jgi:hypothetical protein